ncbi:transcription initiation factor TFIID component TAF4 family-domain-containing protein [Choanephora cucurbitarum]|nr:transcription initiation factor TFIID component TAF4 family-domain-containing protein [Choanephora cucurbitarum]
MFSQQQQQQQQQQQLQQLQMQLQQQHQMQIAQAQAQKTPRQTNKTPKQAQPVLPPSPSLLQPSPTIATPSVQIAQPAVFKTPTVPATPTLQVPTKTNLVTPSKTTSPSNDNTLPPPPLPNTMPTPNTPSAEPVNPTVTVTNNNNNSGGGDSRIDYDTLTDVMGYAGVDLKEEAEHFMREEENIANLLPDGVDRSKVQDFMNTDMLRTKVLSYAKHVNIKEIDSDFLSYLALATQDRVRTVLEAMVAASKHRTFDPFRKPPTENGHPLFKIQLKQHVTSQLKAIERAERQIELDLDPVEESEEESESEEPGWYSTRSKKPLQSITSSERKVTVQDAIFVMERDVQGGRGTNQRTLLKAYNEWLY